MQPLVEACHKYGMTLWPMETYVNMDKYNMRPPDEATVADDMAAFEKGGERTNERGREREGN
jgi:hypothetical protein